jgi:hypothetical protein
VKPWIQSLGFQMQLVPLQLGRAGGGWARAGVQGCGVCGDGHARRSQRVGNRSSVPRLPGVGGGASQATPRLRQAELRARADAAAAHGGGAVQVENPLVPSLPWNRLVSTLGTYKVKTRLAVQYKLNPVYPYLETAWFPTLEPIKLKPGCKACLSHATCNLYSAALPLRAMSVWDVLLGKWAVPEGEFTVHVGGSSRDVKLTHTFTVS